jgi:ADP-ribose pyrophosphatase
MERTLSSQLIYDGEIVRLRVDSVVRADGTRAKREVVEHSQVVAVVALDGNDNVLLVKQFRLPAGKALLEIPAGGVEPGEEPADAVYREMQEETGYRPRNIERMGGFYTAPGFCTEYLHLYLATGLEAGRLYAEDTAEIEIERVPLSEVGKLIQSGTISDAKSIAGLLTCLTFYQPAG